MNLHLSGIHQKATFAWLLTAFVLGFVLRWFFMSPIFGVNYQFLLHAHSHVALLGWVYGGMYLLICSVFVPKNRNPHYQKLFFWM